MHEHYMPLGYSMPNQHSLFIFRQVFCNFFIERRPPSVRHDCRHHGLNSFDLGKLRFVGGARFCGANPEVDFGEVLGCQPGSVGTFSVPTLLMQFPRGHDKAVPTLLGCFRQRNSIRSLGACRQHRLGRSASRAAERHKLHSHAERGNDQMTNGVCASCGERMAHILWKLSITTNPDIA